MKEKQAQMVIRARCPVRVSVELRCCNFCEAPPNDVRDRGVESLQLQRVLFSPSWTTAQSPALKALPRQRELSKLRTAKATLVGTTCFLEFALLVWSR